MARSRHLTQPPPAGRALAGIVLAAILLSACGNGPSDGDLRVDGRVFSAGGIATGGALVHVLAPPDAEGVPEPPEPRHDMLLAEGLACIDERPPRACDGVSGSARTDAEGGFSVVVPGTEPPEGAVGGPVALVLSARARRESGELTGASAAARLVVAESPAPLGDLVLWAPALEVSPVDGGGAVVRWSPHPQSGVSQYRVVVESGDGDLLFDVRTRATEVTVPLDAVDGSSGAVSVIARSVSGAESWRSPRIPYRADAGSVVLAATDEVPWPSTQELSEGLVLTAITGLLVASSLLVAVTGSRHRWRLRGSGGSRSARRGAG